ncbi:DUF2797 domain-containing protein [Nocardia caishijiensis]|uniref:Uncharacterized protein DUF2797 n=1 Tax=Nocardia caishijiensis TaxID=184756 RepID=A0ABQ6YI59_9NOCA|nr:DUF2797 domain-containing protein [Nocardia caishijiensis]KAF0845454.1 uncharacterized protein DUF2797 [Nocardia caishijiensis]
MTSTALYCGTRWDEQGRWWYELQGGDGTVDRLPGVGTRLAFRVAEGRYCLGYRAFGAEPGRRPCPHEARVDTGHQCERCRIREGWSVVHSHRGPLTTLPEQVRDYMARPHHLYIAYFGDGMAKVGTASAQRRHRRLFEQGALAARFITDSPDGLYVRELERVVTERAGLRQSVPGVTKTRILTRPLRPWSAVEAAVDEAAAHAASALPDEIVRTDIAWSGGRDFYTTIQASGRFPDPVEITSAAGEYVFDAVAAHGHTLACRDRAGAAELVLVNDSRLVGRRIELDPTIDVTPEPAQTSLF